MATETNVQTFIHALEVGGWVSRIRFILLLAAISAVYCIVILSEFKGLSHAKGMDQAQIGRALASGHGFSTKYIRPLAYGQFARHGVAFTGGDIPDTYNAPLNPLLDSLLLRLTRRSWAMSEQDVIYTSDRVIAGASLLLFLIAVAINYGLIKRMFDRRLALLTMGLVLICDTFWNFSLSGLPQMLMLVLFSALCYCLLRAIDARQPEGNPPPQTVTGPYIGEPMDISGPVRRSSLWLALCGILLGLLVLAHGLAAWILLGAAVYLGVSFRPRVGPVWKRILLHPVWIPLLIAAAVVAPWLWRTYQVCGNPMGVAFYSGLEQLLGSEGAVMRSLRVDTSTITFTLVRAKVQQNFIAQISTLYSYLGHSLVAPVFFLSLLHLFKRPGTASFRWCLLSMWGFAVLGMCLFGLEEEGPIHANDLHVLFIPMTMAYGLAFVLTLWSRMNAERPEVNVRLVRWGFFALIYLFSGFPLLHDLLTTSGRVQWPPYVPPYIAILGNWTNEDEIITSDMPWAVAWYADRKSLLLPDTVANFIDLYDYDRLGGRIVGLYLTPVSGDTRFLSDIMNGEYKEWAPFILRNVSTRSFPLDAVTALPLDNECVFYADRNRWSVKTD